MDPENIAEPTDEERTAADQAGEDAFADSFKDDGQAPPAERVPKKPVETAAAPAAAPAPAPAKPAASAEPTKDPFAGLSDEARAILASVPTLRHQFDSLNGRYVALQRELAEARAKPATSAAPAAPSLPAADAPSKAKREAIRAELPEVAEAMDELEALALKAGVVAAPSPAPTPGPAAAAPSAPEKTAAEIDLESEHPDYVKKLSSSEFEMWLVTLPKAEADKIRSATGAATVSRALDRFDAFQAQAAAQREAATRTTNARSNRVANAAQPQRGNARPAAATPSEDVEAAFQAGFNGP